MPQPDKKGNTTLKTFVIILFILTSLHTSLAATLSADPNVNSKQDENSIIERTYSFDAPQVTTVNGLDSLALKNLKSTNIPGAPIMPFYDVRLLLPPHTDVVSIEIVPTHKEILADSYVLENGQEQTSLDSPAPPTPTMQNPEIYESYNQYPGVFYENNSVQRFRGYQILFLNLYPVQYIPKIGKVWYWKEMTITVHLRETTRQPSDTLYRNLREDELGLLEKNVDNPEDIVKYSINRSYQSISSGYDLLILTSDSLRDSFAPLVAAHNAEGCRTLVRTLTDIGNTTPTGIRDYVRFAYQTWNIEYVLLGGDSDVIPVVTLLYDLPSDVYYACLDGPYNNDRDGFWGEYNDGENGNDVDLLAEVYVGRACVNTPTEVRYFIEKTLKYMKLKPTDDYLKCVALAGENMYPGWGGAYMDELINGSTHNGYTTVGIPYNSYKIERVYDRPGYTWPNTEIINRTNSGVHIINHMGHSGAWYNMRLYTEDVDNLTNTRLCFIYSQGCDAGAFDNRYHGVDCIAEHFTIKSANGAFAGIWNTREGWYQEGGTRGASQSYHREFWDAVFGENISVISVANQDSKEDNICRFSDPCMRECFYELTLFGDPTLAFHNRPLHVDANGPYTGITCRPVQFRGTVYSALPPYRWFWDFGDGNTSNQKNPRHTYQQNGRYTVTLTVRDRNGRNETNSTTATISLFANIQGPTDGITFEDIQFIGSVTGGFPDYVWRWDFGDGYNAYGQNVTYNYSRAGVYNVTLTVIDSYGNSGTATHQITILANLVYVDDDNFSPPWDGTLENPYPSIQMGVENVCEDGTVFVFNGWYSVDIFIMSSVTLIGECQEDTIITYTGGRISDNVFIFGTHNVTITNFTFLSLYSSIGSLTLYGSNVCNISHNIFQPLYPWNHAVHCIYLIASMNNKITENRIDDAIYGIKLSQGSSLNKIFRNTIRFNEYGVYCLSSSNNIIYNNNFINNTLQATTCSINQWDRGYPAGGNYWSDFDEPMENAFDAYQGLNQSKPGADFIVDLGPPSGGLNPYLNIGGDNRDWYPFIIPIEWDEI
jgi:parallel beta-helix repeat protein